MNAQEIYACFIEPFEPSEVKWKPGATTESRAMALAYVDARVVMDRLDEVVGMHNWKCTHQRLSNDQVACKLSVRIDGEWIEKEDVGSESQQPSEGDKTKAAFSDSLKRAAVLFGIGRYLYRLPSQWVAFDSKKKRITETPKLPEWALPSSHHTPALSKKESAPLAAPAATKQDMPRNGSELWELIKKREEELVKRQLCKPGELVQWVEAQTKEFPSDREQWQEPQIEKAYTFAKTIHQQIVSRKSNQGHSNAA
jgi:hypothetical protein